MHEKSDDGKSTRLGKYCGAIYPTFLVSSRNAIKLTFNSTGGTYNGGFKIVYSVMNGKQTRVNSFLFLIIAVIMTRGGSP